MTRRPHLLALALLTAAACSGDRSDTGDSTRAAATQSGASRSGNIELEDVTAYRLTMPKLNAWMDANERAVKGYAALSPAERAAYKARQDNTETNDDIAGMMRHIERDPIVSKAVRDAGLSPREYSLISLSMLQSGMAAAVLQMRPKDNQDSLVREMKANMDNVRFMREHEAEIKRKQAALDAQRKAAGLDDDGGSDDGSDESEDY